MPFAQTLCARLWQGKGAVALRKVLQCSMAIAHSLLPLFCHSSAHRL